jgi:hypothetical protein
MSDYPSTEQILSEVAAESKQAEPAQTPEAKVEQPQGPSWQEDEYEIEGGKRIKEPREMILKRAGFGYHAAQKLQYANQILEKYKGYDERISALSKWQEFDDYARTNPEWARHVEEAYNNRSNMQQSNQDPVTSELQTLKAELAELKGLKDEIYTAKQAQVIEAEDKQFSDEITETAKQFKVDLSQSNEKGESLELQVLTHMKAMGLDGSKPGHFRAAFKDYYFDRLMDLQKEQVKVEQAKTIEDHKKVGILGVSRTPKASKAFNPKDFSYEQLAEMAKQDMQEARAKKG